MLHRPRVFLRAWSGLSSLQRGKVSEGDCGKDGGLVSPKCPFGPVKFSVMPEDRMALSAPGLPDKLTCRRQEHPRLTGGALG